MPLTVCLTIQADMSVEDRQDAYDCDVTYLTNAELGFDYLRDNLALVRPRASACSPPAAYRL